MFDPTSSVYRWIVMITAGLMLFGGSFAYDSIAAISQLLIEQDGYTTTEVGLMDSLYSWPNILGSVLLAGILVDQFGTKTMSLVFCGLIVIGTVIVALAPSFIVLLIGRALLGIGAEALAVCQSTILHKWFKGKNLALSFGLALIFLRLGAFAAQNLETPVAAHYGGTGAALWLAAAMCGLSLVVAIVYVGLETAADGKVEFARQQRDKLILADILKFDARFWAILVFVLACYGAIIPFRALAQDFFHDAWGLAPNTGASLVSMLSSLALILAPVIGWVVDKRGRRATLLLCSASLLIPAHLLMAMGSMDSASFHPVFPMMILALSYAVVGAVVWPSVPLVVDDKMVGTAFGLIFMVQNIGLALFPVLNGALRDATASYAASELMFAGLGLVALIAALLLRRADREAGGVLELEVMQAAAGGREDRSQ